ncbi:MAG: hypothetical protein WCK11_01705 [Candidatus Falkowbacteria bacterium]
MDKPGKLAKFIVVILIFGFWLSFIKGFTEPSYIWGAENAAFTSLFTMLNLIISTPIFAWDVFRYNKWKSILTSFDSFFYFADIITLFGLFISFLFLIGMLNQKNFLFLCQSSQCHIEEALYKKDITACELLKDDNSKLKCFLNFSYQWGENADMAPKDLRPCQEINKLNIKDKTYHYNECVVRVAKITGEISFCQQLDTSLRPTSNTKGVTSVIDECEIGVRNQYRK